jgi:hypothetical protein
LLGECARRVYLCEVIPPVCVAGLDEVCGLDVVMEIPDTGEVADPILGTRKTQVCLPRERTAICRSHLPANAENFLTKRISE